MRKFAAGLWVVLIFAGCASAPVVEERSPAEWGATPVYARESYDAVMELLSKGRQIDAEYLIMGALEEAPDSQRLRFLSGVLWRSRFENKLARADFAEGFALDNETELAKVSSVVVSMDSGIGVEEGFQILAEKIEKYPDEILFRWLYAIEARYHNRHVEEAGKQFRTILKAWDFGPVMVHKTYATLLTTGLDDPREALEHRMIAVELEPEDWSYQGLANTYKKLKRYEAADSVYEKLLEMRPYNSIYWIQWGTCRFYMEDFEGAAEKFAKANLLNAKDVSGLIFWGRCLEKLGRPKEGFAKYQEALSRSPKHPQAKAYGAQAMLFGHGTAPDFEAAVETCRIPGRPAIDQLREMIRFASRSDNPIAPEKSAVLLPALEVCAEAGDAAAAYSLGMIHRYGLGVAESEELAMKWLTLAAKNGHEIANREINPPKK